MTRMPATLCLVRPMAITTAITTAISPVTVQGLARAKSIGFQGSFKYGSAGTTCNVIIQTSFDGGQTFWDVVNFSFTTATANYYCNVSGLTPVTWAANTPAILTNGTLANDTVNDGYLGDQWRALVSSTGTYANTFLSVYATARD
jgi:hypothetical protein